MDDFSQKKELFSCRAPQLFCKIWPIWGFSKMRTWITQIKVSSVTQETLQSEPSIEVLFWKALNYILRFASLFYITYKRRNKNTLLLKEKKGISKALFNVPSYNRMALGIQTAFKRVHSFEKLKNMLKSKILYKRLQPLKKCEHKIVDSKLINTWWAHY